VTFIFILIVLIGIGYALAGEPGVKTISALVDLWSDQHWLRRVLVPLLIGAGFLLWNDFVGDRREECVKIEMAGGECGPVDDFADW
jgi:hypothetical protein